MNHFFVGLQLLRGDVDLAAVGSSRVSKNADELVSGRDDRAQVRFASTQKVVVRQPGRRRVRVVDLQLDLLSLLEAVLHDELLLPLGTQVVDQCFCSADFVPLSAFLQEQDAEGVRLREGVPVDEVLAFD